MDDLKYEIIQEMVNNLSNIESPKGIVMLPDMDGVKMFEIKADTLRKMLSMKGAIERTMINPPTFKSFIDETGQISVGDTETYNAIINTETCPFNSTRVKENCQYFDDTNCKVKNCKYYEGK